MAQTIDWPADEAGVAGEQSDARIDVWDMTQAERDAMFYESFDDPSGSATPVEAQAVYELTQQDPPQLYLPGVGYWKPLSWRLGYGVARPYRMADMPQSAQLQAGWYLDWTLRPNPDRPNGMAYVQMVRLRQDIDCPIKTSRDRVACPYSVDDEGKFTYTLAQHPFQVRQVARGNRGSLWMIGNEMDRRDWTGGGQDEILPELYAEAYHAIYHNIKAGDPTAKVTVGGIIQPTPLRLEYLSRMWDHYFATYGVPMPVDIWNIHNFIIEEVANGYGADIPPGIGDENTIGEYHYRRDANGNFILDAQGNRVRYEDYSYHIDMYYFDKQIRAMRQWMKDRGEQNKPLVVSEYGVLIPTSFMFPIRPETGTPLYEWDDPTPVVNFMIATFDYFLNAADCNIGYPGDGCRLVQAWNWFSLNPFGQHNSRHTALLDPTTGTFYPAGEAFRNWSVANRLRLGKGPYAIPSPSR